MDNMTEKKQFVEMIPTSEGLKNLAFQYLTEGIGVYLIEEIEQPKLFDMGFRFAVISVNKNLNAHGKTNGSMNVEFRDKMKISEISKLALIEFTITA